MPLAPIKRAEKLSHIMFRKLLYFGCPTNSVWARSYDHLKVNGMPEPDPFINQWREIPWIVWKFWDFRTISWHKTPFKMIVRPSYFVSRLYSSPPPILKVWTSYDNSKSVKSHIFIQNVGHDRPQMTDLLEPSDQNIGFSIRFSNFLVPFLDQELSYGLHILPASHTHVLYRLWWYKIQTMILSRRNVHFVIESSPKFRAKSLSLVIPFTNHYCTCTDSQNRHHLTFKWS